MDKQKELAKAAHALFMAQGFKATSIAEIAARAGVAVGTFYNFYASKTAIFIQIYSEENERVKQEILATVDLDGDPLKVVRTIVQRIFEKSGQNRILQEWFVNPRLNGLIAKTNQDAVANSVVYATLTKLLVRWQQRGLLAPGMDVKRALDLFNALTVLDFHQSEIQTTNYQQVLNDLITGILKVVLK